MNKTFGDWNLEPLQAKVLKRNGWYQRDNTKINFYDWNHRNHGHNWSLPAAWAICCAANPLAEFEVLIEEAEK